AFAKSLGAFESYAALRTSIEDGIRREKEEHESHRVRMEAVENIAVKSVMDIPDALIDREIEKMFSDLESRLAPMGANVDAYLGHLKKTRQDLVKEWHDEAVRRVRIALTLRQIAKAERIEPVGEEVGEKMNELIKEFPSAVEAKKRYSEDSLREYAQQVLANEAVLKLVEQHCVIN
ncbi:MAG: hypothetical protein Q8Q39_04010, partial [bacterium]|nr:hypothetical protein [bacterium]